MIFADNHLIAKPGLCSSSIVPFPFIHSIYNSVCKTVAGNLRQVAVAGYAYQLSTPILNKIFVTPKITLCLCKIYLSKK